MDDHRRLRHDVRVLYRGVALGDWFFVLGRAAIMPFRDIFPLFPAEGRVLDVGCGRGVLANALALARPRLRILGVDLDPHLIAVARHSIRGRHNVAFEVGDALALPARGEFDAVAFIDVVHHLPAAAHARILQGVRPLLRPGGTLILKEIDRRPRWKYAWNYLHDLLVTGGEPIACRASADLMRLLDEAGYAKVSLHSIRSPYPYPHYAVTAEQEGGRRNGGTP